MFQLAFHNLARRRLRTGLTLSGIAVAMAVLACLLAFGEGYQASLDRELNRMGMQLMLVPLGCPFDAAARVLKGKALDVSLPASALDAVYRDPAVAVAAPLFMATVPRPTQGRTDLWVGVDEAIRPLKPWWSMQPGSRWFSGPDEVILGAEAAAAEMRQIGDAFYSPETGKRLKVCGILARSGTSDDSQFFVPLATAQAMFHQSGRLTAVAVRLKDPALLPDVTPRLQAIPGAQVATMTEMMGTFQNLIGAVRTLVMAIAIVALTISALAVFNTMLASVLERTGELGVLRAVGASRGDLFRLLTLESLLLTLFGCLAGLALALALGRIVAAVVARFVPLAAPDALAALTLPVVVECLLVGVGMGLAAGLFPAWKASRLQPALALRSE